MSMQEEEEICELTAQEVDLVEGGLRFAAAAAGGVLALGVEFGGTQYVVNIGVHGVSAFTAPAS